MTDSITNRIRRLRFDHNEMTQQVLAEKARVTRQTIIALEANRYVPSLLLAYRIARVFGVTIEEVFQFKQTAPDAGRADTEGTLPSSGPSRNHSNSRGMS